MLSFMKREFPPVYLALMLIAGCVILRMLNSAFPNVVPNLSPLMAIAYVGAMYLPRAWGWLVGPATFVLTDLAFVRVNLLTDGSGSMFSWWTIISLLLYAAVGGLGILLVRHKSLAKILGGSVACSLTFYVAANTFSWWHDIVVKLPTSYPATWAGWWQANTLGLPGYAPTWVFLRNGVAGDLFFVLVLLAILDRGLLFGHAPERTSTRAA